MSMAFDVNAVTTETLDVVKQITPIEPKRKRKKYTDLEEYMPKPIYEKRCTIDLVVSDPLMMTASLKEKFKPVYVLEADLNNSTPGDGVWGNYPEAWRRTDLSSVVKEEWFPLNGLSFVRLPQLRLLRAPNTMRYQWFKESYEIDLLMMAFKKDPQLPLDQDARVHISHKLETIIRAVRKNGYTSIVFSKLGENNGYPPEEILYILKHILIQYSQMISSVYFCFEPNDPAMGVYQQILYS